MQGYIHSIETFATLDGPGTRFVVFMQGCGFRCLYCHNPDTWRIGAGTKMSADQIVEKLLRYVSYYGEKGGITLSGGEPLIQAEFAGELLRLCKQNNIHTALDTAAGRFDDAVKEVLEHTDLVLLDIKHSDPDKFRQITGRDMSEVQAFLNYIKEKGIKFWARQVIVPGINDTEADVNSLADMLEGCRGLERIELLGYHTLGVEKWHKLEMEYQLEDTPRISEEKLQELTDILKSRFPGDMVC
jgi:pyruvate formate lyase activating enzyme